MEKLKQHTPNQTADNIEKVAALFPNCLVETRDEKGQLKQAIDFDQLRQELSAQIVDGPRERFHLDWPGKREALLAASAPIAKTLRPSREESVNFDTTKNLFIEGDNLDALKLLQETYLGKVKMIYIDPPYNTGKDFIYRDKFDQTAEDYLRSSMQVDDAGQRLIHNSEVNGRYHSDWLSMMYPRLRLARNLLRDDGIIFISIDDHECSALKLICDEVFGTKNFLTQIVWKNRYNAAKEVHLAQIHEYILFYARDIDSVDPIYLPTTEEYVARYFKLKDDKFTTRGHYRLQPLEAGRSMDPRENLRYSLPAPDGGVVNPKRQWKWSKERAMEALAKEELVFTKTHEGWSVSTKQYLRDETSEEYGIKGFSIIEGIYNQAGTKEMDSIFGSVTLFPYPKPTALIRHLLNIGCVKDDEIVLDFFAGSSTTAHAVIAHNRNDGKHRRFIMIQLQENCAPSSEAFKTGFSRITEIAKERIRRCGKLESPPSVISNEDVGFRVLKIDSSCRKNVFNTPDEIKQDQLEALTDNIKQDRTPEDLLFQVLVDWGVDLALPIQQEKITGKTVFFVDGNALAACFDPNVTEELVKELAKRKPLRAVFRDSSYDTDSTKINVEQIFKLLSPETDVKSI